MVGQELCIDHATFSSYFWRKAIHAQANPAVGSFLLQPCAAKARAADPDFRHQPSRGGSSPFISSSRPHSRTTLLGTGLAEGAARASRLGEAGGEQPGSGKWLRKVHFSPWAGVIRGLAGGTAVSGRSPATPKACGGQGDLSAAFPTCLHQTQSLLLPTVLLTQFPFMWSPLYWA